MVIFKWIFGWEIMQKLTEEEIENSIYFLKLAKIMYLKNPEKIKEEINLKYDYDEIYCFNKNNHSKISNNILKKIFFKLKSKYDLVDLQFVVAIKKYAKEKKGKVTIVFKGSKEKEDWLTNFSLKLANHNGLKKSVHSGFYNSFKLFKKAIKSKKDDKELDFLSDIEFLNNNYEINICGHSLGGAIATITGCYFYDLGIKKENLRIYTFGAPPIAKKIFCDYYKNSFSIFRFVNKEDPVPNIAKVIKLEHLGEKILLDTKEIDFHNLTDYEKILQSFQNL